LLKRFFPSSKIRVIGIQPKSIEFGNSLSREMENKIEEVAERVKSFL